MSVDVQPYPFRWLSGLFSSLPSQSVQIDTMHMKDVWDQGYTGKGIGIAVIDTGVTDHPDVHGRIAAFKDFVNGRPDLYDDQGHGTAVAVAAVGNGAASQGRFDGPAPDATVVGLKAVDGRGYAYTSRVVEAIQWAIDNKARYNIRVLNMSFYLDDPQLKDRLPVLDAVEKAAQAGIIPVVAAGNDGPGPSTIRTLASYPHVVTVAAFDPRGTVQPDDDRIARFSSRGPGENHEDKPDVAAPGVGIVTGTTDGGYRKANGTSFAAPLTAGVIATWLQANPNLTVADVQHIIQATSHPILGTSHRDEGYGEIDPVAGLKMALQMRPA